MSSLCIAHTTYMCNVHLVIDSFKFYLKCQSETHLSEENDETTCAVFAHISFAHASRRFCSLLHATHK